MKNVKIILSFLFTMLFVTTGHAALKDRLEPILSGNVNIWVDTFVIGTQDKYIATIARDLDQAIIDDFTLSMREMLNLHDHKALVLVEKQVFDKKSKKYALAERNLVFKSDFHTRISAEPMINSEMQEIKPGSVEEIIWNKVAGQNGLGSKTLNEYPAPLELDKQYKNPVDKERYAIVAKNEIGGIFLDKNSIKKTEVGCSALIVEAFNFDGETNYGGMVTQYTYQPYVDAYYSVSTYEYSFKEKAYRELRLSIFSADGKVIYSIKHPTSRWVTDGSAPMLPHMFMALRRNLPKDVSESLAEDIKSFDTYVQEKIVEKQKAMDAAKKQEKPVDAPKDQNKPQDKAPAK